MQAELEQRILDNPDDLGAFAVYADWLTEKGDPRGTFLRLQLQLEDPTLSPSRRESLQAQEHALLQEHVREWLGPLAQPLLDVRKTYLAQLTEAQGAPPLPRWKFERGFLVELHLDTVSPRMVEALKAWSGARFLCHLTVERCSEEAGMAMSEVDFAGLRTLRCFALNKPPRPGLRLAPWVARLSRLTELVVEANLLDTDELFRVPLPTLRSLTIRYLREFSSEALATNTSLGHLESIDLEPRETYPDPDLEGYLRLRDLDLLVRSPHLTRLRSLSLTMCTAGDAGCRSLVDSGVLSRLVELRLPYGEITDEGARLLASSPHLGHLEKLDVSGNSLTEDGLDLLRSAGIPQLHEGFQQRWEQREYLNRGTVET